MTLSKRFERMIQRVHGRGDLLGAAGGAVEDQLVDGDGVSDLLEGLLGSEFRDQAMLRGSRMPRIRPVLVVLAARAAGASAVDEELQYAAELLFMAVSVHDLALGHRGGKRRRVARTVLQRSVGWMGGNQLVQRSMELVRHSGSPELLCDLVDTLGVLQQGQQLASELQNEGVPSVDLWREHADGHTGALFAFCSRAGAHLAGSTPGRLSTLGRYGRHIGRLWHIAEDVCLLQSDDAAEQLLSRGLTGRPMLPVVIAIERSPEIGVLWRSMMEAPEIETAETLVQAVAWVGGLTGTREIMAQEAWAACRLARRLDPTIYRRGMERLATGLAKAPFEASALT